MDWGELTESKQLIEIENLSKQQPVLIFKHSTRCSISSMALNRMETNWDLNITSFYLDLIAYRDISNEIAAKYNVQHQSPQVLIIQNGKCVYHASHNAISVDAIKEAL